MKPQQFWLGVVSYAHVMIGKENGFAQLCHGKKAPLKRLHKNDILLYYSPKISMEKADLYQCFTAFGVVKDDSPYQVTQFEHFHPFRRNIHYLATVNAPIKPLIPYLSFISNKQHWGYPFRFGLIEINYADTVLIATAMQITKEKLHEIIL